MTKGSRIFFATPHLNGGGGDGKKLAQGREFKVYKESEGKKGNKR